MKIDFNSMSEQEIMKLYQQQQKFFEQFNEWKQTNEEPTPRVKEHQALESRDIVRARGEYRLALNDNSVTYDTIFKFDWSKTDVFKKALKFHRFKMPSLTVQIEQEIIRNIYNLRKNKEQH